MPYKHILTQTKNLITTITLNRPEKHNALNPLMLQELLTAVQHADHDDQTTVILLNANGKNFCAGADLAWMRASQQLSFEENQREAAELANFFTQLYAIKKPMVVAAQGKTFGGGIGILCCADIVIAADDASFAFSEVKLGLAPATIAPFVIAAIGPRQAKRFFLSAELFNSRQAQAIELAHIITPLANLEQTAQSLAIQLTNNSLNAMMRCKQLINTTTVIDEKTIAQSIELISNLRTSDDAQARLASFFAKT